MLTMNLTKMQNIFLGRLKQTNKIINNVTYFNISSSFPHIIYNDYSTSCTNIAQDSILNNQQPVLLNNLVAKRYNSRKQYNHLNVSQPQIISQALLHNGKKHVGYKTCCSNQYYNSVRHLSNISSNSIAEIKDPSQFNYIFKTLSESTPVRIAQDSLLWIHDYTGLPWWLIIVLTTIMMRTTVTLPLFFYQQYILAKLENLKPEMDEIVKELKVETNYAMHKFNWSKEYARPLYNRSLKKQWNKLIVRENCHPAKASIVILFQVPLWISLSMSIRNLCYMLPKQDANAYATYQEFATDGLLWITNLTVADPFVLPVAMGLFNLAIIEITYMNRKKELTKFMKYMTNFFRILAIGMIPIAMYVPSCVSLYWATSSAFGLFQNLIVLSPKLRRFARVPITPSESPRPYSLLREQIIARGHFERKVEIPPKI
ncbi:cytochrome c oxidase assembly protein COX18, mitochondrial [Linepithema humile]|uniref:cytochrome c oxidase assembly protein COX18, mitochondrial n=1 Tax=Linepithema humile TaxID=83485 RepID=UPI00351F696A